jgi:AraC-like DNA-binding protein
MPITFHYEGPSEHLYCHFSLPEIEKSKTQPSEFIQNDARLPQLKSLLAGAISLKRSAAPQRANLRLWEVLLGIQDVFENADNSPTHERIVETISEIVMQEMARPPTIRELARRCQVSHNQLTRILKQQTGESPAPWLRRLRTDRAKELLSYSDLPIKVIAAEVGYPDLQHFNKVMRRQHGQSPRAFRK